MARLLIKGGPGSESQNTFNLPTGGDILAAIVGVFKDQHSAMLAFLDNFKASAELEFKWGLPLSFPTWDSLGLGVANIVDRLKSSIADIWEKAGSAFLSSIGVDPDLWDVTVPKLDGMITQEISDLATEVNATTSQQLEAALIEATTEVNSGKLTMEQAETQLTEQVNEIFDDAESWRAKRIAVTEASRAFHAAQNEAAKESGLVAGWKWMTATNACDLCHEIARMCRFVPIGQPFAYVGNNPKYQEIDYPPAHPNCRCSMLEVLYADEQPEWGQTLMHPELSLGESEESAAKAEPIRLKSWPKPKAFPKPSIKCSTGTAFRELPDGV